MIKYIAASIWALASCFFLWFFTYMSALPNGPHSSPYPTASGDLFLSFIVFTLVVTVGGVSYFVLTKIIDAPYDEKSKAGWGKLVCLLGAALTLEFSIMMVLVFLRDFYIGVYDVEIFTGSFVVLWLAAVYLIRRAVISMRDMRVLGSI